MKIRSRIGSWLWDFDQWAQRSAIAGGRFLALALIIGGSLYWLGLVGLLVATAPGDRLNGSINLPGGRWFIHAAAASAILAVGGLLSSATRKR